MHYGTGERLIMGTGMPKAFSQVSRKNVPMYLFPVLKTQPVYWGISSNQQNDVMLYSNHVNSNDNVQLCISSFFAQGIANSASSIKNIVYLSLLPIIVMLNMT